MTAPHPLPPVVFEALYERLRQEGFGIGVDQRVQLETLVDRLDMAGQPPEHLKTLLCPIFAANPAQQEAFYRIFEETYPKFAEAPERALPPFVAGLAGFGKPVLEPLTKPWIYALAVLSILGGFYWLLRPSPEPVALPPLPQPPQSQQDVYYRTAAYSIDAGRLARVQSETSFHAVQWTAIAAPLLCFGALWLYWTVRRRTALDKSSGLKPPNFWPLKLEAMGSRIFAAGDLHRAAMLMRRRQDGSNGTLDVPGTIAATMRNAGFPRLVFRAVRRPPEYVALIERESVNDHFAAMIADLVRLLKDDGVYIARYYFTGDPRHLVSESGEALHFSDLAGRRQGDRLLVFGKSPVFLHPSRGHVQDWALPILEQFPLRALFACDGCPRRRLERLHEAGLCVVQASLEGLGQAVRFFDDGGTGAGRPFPKFEALAAPPLEDGGDSSDPLERWIRACSVYPELHWNLTLQLGAATGQVLSEASVSRLSRMIWFRRGEIPPPQREELAESIPAADQPLLQRSLIETLQAHMEPEAVRNFEQTLRVYLPEKRRWWQGGDEAPTDAHDFVFLKFLGWKQPGSAPLPVADRSSQWLQRNARWLAPALTLLLLAVFRPWHSDVSGKPEVRGAVIDETGQPVAGVEIAMEDSRQVTDSRGSFFLGSLAQDAGTAPLEIKTEFWPRGATVDPAGRVIARVGRVRRTDGPLMTYGTRPAVNGFTVEFEGAWRRMTVRGSDKSERRFTPANYKEGMAIPAKAGVSYSLDIDGTSAGKYSTSGPTAVPTIVSFISEWVVNPNQKPGEPVDVARLTYSVRDATSAHVETSRGKVPLTLPAGSIIVEPEQSYSLVAENGALSVTNKIGLPPKEQGIAKPRIVQFELTPKRIKRGEKAMLRWEVTGARGLRLYAREFGVFVLRPDGSRPDAVKGELAVTPSTGTIYRLSGEYLTQTELPAEFEDDGKAPEVTFTAEPTEITAGQTAKLVWSAPGAERVYLMVAGEQLLFGSSDEKARTGERVVRPDRDTVYTFGAAIGSHKSERSLTVRVRPAPIVTDFSFTSDRQTVPEGEKVRLSWAIPPSSTGVRLRQTKPNAVEIPIAPGQTTASLEPPRGAEYTLEVEFKEGVRRKSLGFDVTPAARNISFEVTPANVTAGQTVTVTWDAPGANGVLITAKSARKYETTPERASGTRVSSALEEDTVFTLSVYGSKETRTAEVKVSPRVQSSRTLSFRIGGLVCRQDGSLGTTTWDFDIQANGRSVFAVRDVVLGDKKVSCLPPALANRSFSADAPNGRVELSISAVHSHNRSLRATSRPVMVEPGQRRVDIPISLPNPKDGAFTFILLVEPGPASNKAPNAPSYRPQQREK